MGVFDCFAKKPPMVTIARGSPPHFFRITFAPSTNSGYCSPKSVIFPNTLFVKRSRASFSPSLLSLYIFLAFFEQCLAIL
uniref:Uncharacterized protein n=1 Tax=Arundo donax TaxID=35708 RepID=A0A0A9A2Z1_ARUDO